MQVDTSNEERVSEESHERTAAERQRQRRLGRSAQCNAMRSQLSRSARLSPCHHSHHMRIGTASSYTHLSSADLLLAVRLLLIDCGGMVWRAADRPQRNQPNRHSSRTSKTQHA